MVRIENEGFNTQKHHGYALQHKYARVSWPAAKNYYQCLQIGHLINQLMVLSAAFQPLLQGKITRAHRWRAMMAFLLYGPLHRATLEELRPTPLPDSLHVAALETACSDTQASPFNPQETAPYPNLQPQCRPTSSTTTHAMGFGCREGAQVSCALPPTTVSLRLIRGVML